VRPIRLEANQPPRFYRGGSAISRFRGMPPPEREDRPEDWVGSATTIFGQEHDGLTTLPDGRSLRGEIAADPEAWLGGEQAAAFDGHPGLLVKLLDAAERLPVHLHPDRAFARRHLDCPYGKTEAWVILETRLPGATVHVGFTRDIEADTLRDWVDRQDTTALLGSLHALPVEPGDALLVPAGVPHAIGEGVFLVELQEPTDFSVLLEWDGFAVDGRTDGHLALGYDVALGAVDRSGLGQEHLAALRTRTGAGRVLRPGVRSVFVAAADPFFRAEEIRPSPLDRLEPGFSVLVVRTGGGALESDDGTELSIGRGDTILVPFGAGNCVLAGDVEVIRCRPPSPTEKVG
jgi:mannose-6-phosphate isomerase